MSGKRRRVPVVALTLLVLAAAGTVALLAALAASRSDQPRGLAVDAGERRGPFRGNVLPPGLDGAPAPEFRLRSARGGTFGTADVAGKPYAVTFLYTDCDDVCPLIAQELRVALERLGPRGKDVAVVAVSADPRRDTREAVRKWLRRNRMPRNFHYLIGTRRELKPVWSDFYAAPQTHPERGNHSASIWLVDARGRLRTKFSAGFPIPPGDIAHDFRVLLREVDGGRPGGA